MKKDFAEMVRVIYGDKEMDAYLTLTESSKSLMIILHPKEDKELYDELYAKQENNNEIVVHCRKITGSYITLFGCTIRKIRQGSDIEITLHPAMYVDNYMSREVSSIGDFKLSNLTAVYSELNSLFTGPRKDTGEQENIEGVFKDNNGDEFIFMIKFFSNNYTDRYETKTIDLVSVTLQTKKEIPFLDFKKLFFGFSTMFSFYAEYLIHPEYYTCIDNDDSFPNSHFEIYTDYRMKKISNKKIRMNNVYQFGFDFSEIKNAVIDPILTKEFRFWLNYVSTIRFENQPLEDKFLSYYRSLEGLAGSKTNNNKIYSKLEYNELAKNVEDSLRSSSHAFSEEDISYIIQSGKQRNFRNAGDVIQELVKNELGIVSIDLSSLDQEEPLYDYLKSIRGLRDRLSHGRGYNIEDADIDRILYLKKLIKNLLLNEKGIFEPEDKYQYDFEPLDPSKVKEAIKKFEEIEKESSKNLSVKESFNKQKERIQSDLKSEDKS